MKFKFNLKLTLFLVSLFVSLLLVILGSKNKYCLCFGFILMGVSLVLFTLYHNEKVSKELINTNETLNEVENDEELTEDEQVYVMEQLFIRQKNLIKKKRSVIITFDLCGFAIAILGIISVF